MPRTQEIVDAQKEHLTKKLETLISYKLEKRVNYKIVAKGE